MNELQHYMIVIACTVQSDTRIKALPGDYALINERMSTEGSVAIRHYYTCLSLAEVKKP